MSADRETRGAGRSDAGLDAEQEVDLSRFWWTVVGRWWLVALGVALGALVGYLVSLGGGHLFQAKATVYLGQPLTPSSNAQIQSLQTNPSTVNQIIKSQSVVLAVASRVGVPPGKLRSGISSKPVAGSLPKVGQTQLVEIIVRGPWKRQSADAANALAQAVVDRVSSYPDAKIAQLDQLAKGQDEQLTIVEDAIAGYRTALAGDTSLSSSEKLVLVGLLGDAEQQRGLLLEQKTQTELSLSLAQDVERGQLVTRAAATKAAARGRRSSLIVGAIIGFLVGVAAALLWDPVKARLARSGGT